MNRQPSEIKKRETVFIIVLAVLFAVVILVSRFVFGVDLKSMEFSLQHPGTQEISGDGLWTVSFVNYIGEIEHEIRLPEKGSRHLRIRCEAQSGDLNFSLDGAGNGKTYTASDEVYEFENTADTVFLHICANEAVYGAFSAIWD